MKKLGILAASIAAAVGVNSAANAECGEVLIGQPNWLTAELVAAVDALVLEQGYGCSVSIAPTATTNTIAFVQGADGPALIGEVWTNGLDVAALESAQSNGELELLQSPFSPVGEFWFVSEAFARDYPELDTVAEVIQRPDLFPSLTEEGKGAFFGCPVGVGWACEGNNLSLFHHFGMDELGWVHENPASVEGQAALIVDSKVSDSNWIGYYWTPTAVSAQNGLVPLDWGVDFAGTEFWDTCVAEGKWNAPGCERTPTAWVESVVNSVISPETKDLDAFGYISSRQIPSSVLAQLEGKMADEQMSGADAAVIFIRDFQDIWTPWVDADAAEALLSSL